MPTSGHMPHKHTHSSNSSATPPRLMIGKESTTITTCSCGPLQPPKERTKISAHPSLAYQAQSYPHRLTNGPCLERYSRSSQFVHAHVRLCILCCLVMRPCSRTTQTTHTYLLYGDVSSIKVEAHHHHRKPRQNPLINPNHLMQNKNALTTSVLLYPSKLGKGHTQAGAKQAISTLLVPNKRSCLSSNKSKEKVPASIRKRYGPQGSKKSKVLSKQRRQLIGERSSEYN
jgi:hypothetical protein